MKISKAQLFKYFEGKASDELVSKIDAWLGENEENREIYKEASDEYEWLVLNADFDSIKCLEPIYVTRMKKRIKIAVKVLANVAAIAVFFVLATLASQYRVEKDLSSRPVTVTVPDGQRMTLALADGTTVEMNAGAQLTYPALFRGKTRKVLFEGEAIFHVSHKEKHPFIVETFAAEVEVLGTKFGILADSQEKNFSTTLMEGKVKVTGLDNPKETAMLIPGHKLTIENGHMKINEAGVSGDFLWTDGILDISNMSFDRLIRELENAYGVNIIVQRKEMPEIHCTSGKVRISDGIEHALNILKQLSDFEYVKDNKTGDIYIR